MFVFSTLMRSESSMPWQECGVGEAPVTPNTQPYLLPLGLLALLPYCLLPFAFSPHCVLPIAIAFWHYWRPIDYCFIALRCAWLCSAIHPVREIAPPVLRGGRMATWTALPICKRCGTRSLSKPLLFNSNSTASNIITPSPPLITCTLSPYLIQHPLYMASVERFSASNGWAHSFLQNGLPDLLHGINS